jgi:hypothetical protein
MKRMEISIKQLKSFGMLLLSTGKLQPTFREGSCVHAHELQISEAQFIWSL